MKVYQYLKKNGIFHIEIYDVPFQPGEIVYVIKTKEEIIITKNPTKFVIMKPARPVKVIKKAKPTVIVYSKRPIDNVYVDNYNNIYLHKEVDKNV